jgi:hypothetical protein
MKQTIHDIFYVIGILILIIILFGSPLMILWNWLMPLIFNLPEITFWQACGIQLLATLLIKPINYKKD